MTYFRSQRIFLWVAVLAMISLSCNLPIDFVQSIFDNEEASTEGELIAWGLEELEVSTSGDQAIIEIEHSPDQDQEMMIAGWFVTLQAAAEEAPDANAYILRTTYNGEPYLEITAYGDDVRALAAEEISPGALLENLIIDDQRSADSRIFSRLVGMGLDVKEVSQLGSLLYIEYYPEPAEDPVDLMAEWLEMLLVVYEEEAQAEVIEIRAVMLDTSVFVAEVSMTDLRSFYQAELTAVELLGKMMISEEPVVLKGE
jgi:hypothetical protein